MAWVAIAAWAWPFYGAHAAAASCDPSKGYYKVESAGTRYDPFAGSTFFSFKISAAPGSKNISNYVVGTPACKDIKAYTSSVPLKASCVTREVHSGLTGFKVDTGIASPGSRIDTIELNGNYTGSASPFAVKAGTCDLTKGTVTLSPYSKVASGTVKFKQPNLTVSETSGVAVITVSRVNGGEGTLTVNYKTVDGTAMAGTDYTAVTGTLTWANYDTADKVIYVPVTNTKTYYEAAKTYSVALTTTDNNYTAVTEVSITSNPPVTVSQSNVVVSSYEKVATVELARTEGVELVNTVSAVLNTQDLTAVAGKDYVAITDLAVTLEPEQQYTAVTVYHVEASTVEDRKYAVVVSDAGYRQATAVVTIRGTASASAVEFTNLQDGATVAGATAVELTASQNVAPVRYDLFADGTLVASQDTTANQATLTWDTTQVADGSHTLQAKLYYAATVESSDPITVIVVNQAAQPAGTITSPKDGYVAVGTVNVTYVVAADTVEAELSVCGAAGCTSVETQNPAKGSYAWDSTTVANGDYTLKVTATSADGTQTAGSVTITVANQPVAVAGTITSPQDAYVAAGTVNVTYVVAADTVEAELSVCGGAGCTSVETQTPATGSFAWDSTTVANGDYTLKVTATSADGVQTADSVTITVANQQDQIAGTILSPKDGQAVSGIVKINYVVANDTVKAALVVGCGASGCLYQDMQLPPTGVFAWDSSKVDFGSYAVTVTATASDGTETSDTITVKVSSGQ